MRRFFGVRISLLGRVTETEAAVAEETNFTDLLATMDLAFRGAPFVQGPTKATTDLQPMDYTFRGAPFVTYRKAS